MRLHLLFCTKMARIRRMEKAVCWSDDRYWATWDKWGEVIDWGDEKELCSPAESPSDQADSSTESHSRRRIAKAVSWTDDAYWAAWDKWEEIICWGDEEECSQVTPPTSQLGRDEGIDVHGLEAFVMNNRTISIKPVDNHRDSLEIGAVLVDLCQFDLEYLDQSKFDFEIVQVQIGEVKVEETREKAFEKAFELEIVDVAVEVINSEFQLNAINLDIVETKVDKLLLEELIVGDLEAGNVKVSVSNGNVVKVPLRYPSPQRNRRTRQP
ncbi:uncharacterized protein LOC125723412 isoform X1 [Brienomyrus brachyistius]|uniref:uncharacterized protein LOC125723412 isoform X1 n=1 Tax=Brienomyrus brachyistius TaxID=42636 RepID=UPI0020B292BE|nr:uncharacterized protein LOC125723412 isoform X1 [Brienomyrus brachyistius]